MEESSSSYWASGGNKDKASIINDNSTNSRVKIGLDPLNTSSCRDGHSNNKDAEDDTGGWMDVEDVTVSDTPTMEGTRIKAIDRNVVHQICSGQVIVTLSTAVKELVENAIDAGATSVEIRLLESGSKLIEVIDNGVGVEEINFEGLALKHHTSKISEFEDLVSVETFGFRGEALSSLCALSDLSVNTRSKKSESKIGFKIDYDGKGKIVSKLGCAREFGTTVILKNLFAPLPVRHVQFMKNLKKEFHKMITTLYGYCLIAEGVRITCTNQIGNGAPSKVISVPACPTMRERIVAVFGSKQLQSLMEFHEEEVSDEILSEFGLNSKTSMTGNYRISGYVSAPNQGRSSNDRQFFFINSRPCDPSKVSRVVNEAYHGYSRSQSPFVCLNIETRRDTVDVNVTPDKRVLYLQSEKSLFALLKASLNSMYLQKSSIFNLSGTQEILSFSQSQRQSESQESIKSHFSKFGQAAGSRRPRALEVEDFGDDNNFACQFSTNKSGTRNRDDSPRSSTSSKLSSRSFLQNFAHKSASSFRSLPKVEPRGRFNPTIKRRLVEVVDHDQDGSMSVSQAGSQVSEDDDIEIIRNYLKEDKLNNGHIQSGSQCSSSTAYSSPEKMEVEERDLDNLARVVYDDELDYGIEFTKPPNVNINFGCLSEIKSKLKKQRQSEASKIKDFVQKFRAKIAPTDNSNAESELRTQITKDMFMKMGILGQFNLGFVVVKSGSDLFIVDQHASDEKYNFEDLEKTMVMQSQKLISPMQLQLPAVSENVIIDNLEMFQKNGFDFIIDEEEEPTNRIKLSTIPYSKTWEFGKSDVDELIFMMEDAPDKCFCRPSKVRLMLASRACRKSVMIGTALSWKEMKNIVIHMGEMDQPWNCPHGRPTIRHLINLHLLPDMDLQAFNHHI